MHQSSKAFQSPRREPKAVVMANYMDRMSISRVQRRRPARTGRPHHNIAQVHSRAQVSQTARVSTMVAWRKSPRSRKNSGEGMCHTDLRRTNQARAMARWKRGRAAVVHESGRNGLSANQNISQAQQESRERESRETIHGRTQASAKRWYQDEPGVFRGRLHTYWLGRSGKSSWS